MLACADMSPWRQQLIVALQLHGKPAVHVLFTAEPCARSVGAGSNPASQLPVAC